MDNNYPQESFARLYGFLTTEEKDDLLQSLIIAGLHDPLTIPEILQSFAQEKDFQLLAASLDSKEEAR